MFSFSLGNVITLLWFSSTDNYGESAAICLSHVCDTELLQLLDMSLHVTIHTYSQLVAFISNNTNRSDAMEMVKFL